VASGGWRFADPPYGFLNKVLDTFVVTGGWRFADPPYGFFKQGVKHICGDWRMALR